MAEKLQAYCMRCKEKRDIGDSLDADSPYVEKKNGRYMLFGWCPEDNTKMTLILGKSNPSHVSIIEAYESLAKGGKKVNLQVNGQPIKVKPPKEERSAEVKVTGKKKDPKFVVGKKSGMPQVVHPEDEKKKKPAPTKKVAQSNKQSNKKEESKKVAPKKQRKEVKVNAEFPLKIFAEYKGQTFKALMKGTNNISMNKVPYTSLSLAALAVTDGKHVNGWKFWKFMQDGETYSISAIRDESSIQRLGSRAASSPKEETVTIELPNPALPARNNAKIAAAYFVDPKKFDRFGHVVVYLWLRDSQELARIVYDKHGKAIKPSVQQLGKFPTWKEAQPAVLTHAQKNNYKRAKVS